MYRKKYDPTSDLRLRFITKRGKGKEIPVDIKYKWVTTQHMAYGIMFKRLFYGFYTLSRSVGHGEGYLGVSLKDI